MTLFDPVHRLFGVHFMLRFKDASYFMTTALTVLAYLGMVGFIFGLKRLSDQFENTIQQKNMALSLKNEQLSTINIVVEEQKSELLENYEKLKEANKTSMSKKAPFKTRTRFWKVRCVKKPFICRIPIMSSPSIITNYDNFLMPCRTT